MDDFGYYLSADGRPFREVTMPDRSTGAWRRPEAASEQTGQIDMAAVFAKLDQLDRKVAAKHRPAKAKRPLSWQAAIVIVVTVLAIAALVGYLAAVHVIPAL